MTEHETTYQRMLDWCSQPWLAQQQTTVIPGERTIAHDPLGTPGERERGTIANADFDGQEWLGGTVEQVIDLMDTELGKVPETDYQIVE